MTYLRHMTNKQLKRCLLNDMETFREINELLEVDECISVIEEVFRRIDVYSNRGLGGMSKPHDRHALSNKLITNALKRGDI